MALPNSICTCTSTTGLWSQHLLKSPEAVSLCPHLGSSYWSGQRRFSWERFNGSPGFSVGTAVSVTWKAGLQEKWWGLNSKMQQVNSLHPLLITNRNEVTLLFRWDMTLYRSRFKSWLCQCVIWTNPLISLKLCVNWGDSRRVIAQFNKVIYGSSWHVIGAQRW